MMYKGKKIIQVIFLCVSVIYILCSFLCKTRLHWMLRKSKLGTSKLCTLDNMLHAVVLIYSGFVQLKGILKVSSEIFKRSHKQIPRFLNMPLFDDGVLDDGSCRASVCLTVSVL